MAESGGHSKTIQGYAEPILYQQMTSLAAAIGLSSVPPGTKYAIIQAEAQNIRWRDDGANPTATVGMILVANDMLVYSGKMSEIKFIEALVGAKLNIAYYK